MTMMPTKLMLIVIFGVLLSSCTRNEAGNNGVTLASGVSLEDAKACTSAPKNQVSVATKGKGDFRLTVVGFFPCGEELEEPYLTDAIEKKATLVIKPKPSKFGFKSSCECGRSLTIHVTNRLETGDTLYILNDREVLGHVVLP